MYAHYLSLHVFYVGVVISFVCIEKVSPEDVGREAILKNIQSEIVGILGDALQFPMSQMCYCKSPLHRRCFNRPYNDWRCLSCFAIQSGRISFDCPVDDCSFKRNSSSVYRVCPSCFEYPSEMVSSYETEEKEDAVEGTYICRQINQRIALISSDSSYVRVRRHGILIVGANYSEHNLNEMEIEKDSAENFEVCLLRQVSAINSNVISESVQKAVEHVDFSWEMFEYQRKEVVLERLKTIENLNESQCNELFDKMNGMKPTEMRRKRRNCVLSVKRDFYENWIMKCMYSVSECFPMKMYSFCSVNVVGSE